MEERIKYLIDQYLTGQCSRQEKLELESWYKNLGSDKPDWLIEGSSEANKRLNILFSRLKATIDNRNIEGKVKKLRITILRIAAAVFALGILATAAYLFIRKDTAIEIAATVNDAAPGGQHAILTLGDGSVIHLDSTANGQIARLQGMQIIKLDSGSLAYRGEPAEVTYNILSTPNGGQYHIVLPDGSNVWLNAASSIKFPTVFNNSIREVTMTGEAYYEVSHNPAAPFIVKTGNVSVKVLGTHFNINAYKDEPEISTTLIQGSVRVSNGKQTQPLIPGYKASVRGSDISIEPADVEKETAWKYGIFDFNGVSVDEMMRQLSKWYDVEVIYEGEVPKRKFAGQIGRDLMLSEVLKGLGTLGFKFRIEGKKLYLTP